MGFKKFFQSIFSRMFLKNGFYKPRPILGSRSKIREKEKKVRASYENILTRIRNKVKEGNKVKVLFLIRENQKWTYDSLYKEMLNSDLFDPVVVVSVLDPIAKGHDVAIPSLKYNCEFFKKLGYKVELGFDETKSEFIDLKIYNPDVVFYDQLWDLPGLHMPAKVSEFALTCYSSYAYEICNFEANYMLYFHRFLFRYFVEHPSNVERYEKMSKGNSKNCVAVGYPKLDVYFDKPSDKGGTYWREQDKFKIIYAPHHSFEKELSLRCATFKENGRFILELAKRHPETTWLFRPHPRLRYALVMNHIMTKSEMEKYYDEWKKIGSIYEDGNYFDVFRSSDLLITDCSSFRAEYLPTLKPTICLIKGDSCGHNFIGKKIMSVLYQVHDNDELEKTFKLLVQDKQDPLFEKRKQVAEEILNFGVKSSDKILETLKEDIGIE